MFLGLIASETPDLLGHTFIHKTQLDTSSMVIRPVIFLNVNIVCAHLLLSFILLIYLYASGTYLSYGTGLNVTFNYATAPQMRLVSNCTSTWSIDKCNPLFLYTLLTFTTLWTSVLIFPLVMISAVPNFTWLDIVIKSDLVQKHDVNCQNGVLVVVYKSIWGSIYL